MKVSSNIPVYDDNNNFQGYKIIDIKEPDSNEETACPKREDGMHCNCWYDGKACCACGDPATRSD